MLHFMINTAFELLCDLIESEQIEEPQSHNIKIEKNCLRNLIFELTTLSSPARTLGLKIPPTYC